MTHSFECIKRTQEAELEYCKVHQAQEKDRLISAYFPDWGNNIENQALVFSHEEFQKERDLAREILAYQSSIKLTEDEVNKLEIIVYGRWVWVGKIWEEILERVNAIFARFVDEVWIDSQDTPERKVP